MAKKSMIARDKKRLKLIKKFAAKRAALKATDPDALQKLPRNSSPTRRKFRDMSDGRPRGYMRRFGMSRIRFREEASKGNIALRGFLLQHHRQEARRRYVRRAVFPKLVRGALVSAGGWDIGLELSTF